MKKSLLLLFASVLIFTSCNKNGGSENGRTHYPSTAHVIRNAVKDVDGNKYDAVRIGDQVWMASNLKTTHYADGTEIPQGNTSSETQPYRYCPANTPQAVDKYGYLYNWLAVMHGVSSSESSPSGVQGICPEGWHIPSNMEWDELTTTVREHVQSEESLSQALAANDGSWMPSYEYGTPGFNPALNNSTGFSAVPVGAYSSYGCNRFGGNAYFWSATQYSSDSSYAYFRRLGYNNANVSSGFSLKNYGYSVRCLRD